MSYLGGPGSSKAEQVDRIIDKEQFRHINMGTLLIDKLKQSNAWNNDGLSIQNEETNIQQCFADWRNGKLLNSVGYFVKHT